MWRPGVPSLPDNAPCFEGRNKLKWGEKDGGALIVFHMEIKTKRRRAAPSKTHKTSSESPIVLSLLYLPLAEKHKLFLTVSAPTALRFVNFSFFFFVKLKGLYSQWRAARRNFSSWSPPSFFPPKLSVRGESAEVRAVWIYVRISSLMSVWPCRKEENRLKNSNNKKKNAVLGRGLVRVKGMRGGRRAVLRLSGMWLMLQRNNDCDQLSKGLPGSEESRVQRERRGRLHSSKAD